MSHVVLSRDESGEPRVEELGSLEQALEHAERLRNDDGVSDVRVLREVPIEVKTYYKVVALEAADAPAPDPLPGSVAPSVPPAPAQWADDEARAGAPGEPPPGSAVLSPRPSASAADDVEALVTDKRGSRFGRN